jgi:hypothetical protein
MDQTKREHLPNPQNNQIIELLLPQDDYQLLKVIIIELSNIMKTDQKFHHCYPKYPTHVMNRSWRAIGRAIGWAIGPQKNRLVLCSQLL